jgi:homoserine O-acetyltransferase/O-succinyltransferase
MLLGDARMSDRIAARRRKVVAAVAIVGAALASASTAYGQGPFGQTDNPAATQANVVFTNYQFRSGDILPQVRIHYATLGSPHRGTSGQIDNAILVLHWTGSDSRALLTPTYMQALFDPGRPRWLIDKKL